MEWVIVDFETGAMDGFYKYRNDAEAVLSGLREDGARSVALVQVVIGSRNMWMHDRLFWTRHETGFAGMNR